jgi:tetratricopeptide (TPR) repeat protein
VQVIKSDVRRALLGLLMPSASVVLLASIGLQGAFAASMPLFAGITSLETRTDAKGSSQVVAFSADMPFQYQMQILDKNHVVFRLYNARLASNLLTPEGGVNLLATGAVESARLRTSNKAQVSPETYQEIVLTGPDLGTKHFQVQGATELPLVKPLASIQVAGQPASSKSRVTTALAKFASRPIPPGEPVKLVGKHPAKALPNLNLLQRSALQQNMAMQKAAPGNQAMALMAVTDAQAAQERHTDTTLKQRIEIDSTDSKIAMLPPSSSPQIESMTNTATRSGNSAELAASTEAASDAVIETQSIPADSQARPSVPSNEMLIPLPRYQGGAAPIQATTLDAHGNPVMIHPKNSPIQEFDVNSRNGGYNALFQADPEPDNNSRVDGLVNDALSFYRQRQYLQAEQKIQQAMQMKPSNADLYAALAEIQLELDQRESAVQSYRQASQLSPKEYGQAYVQVLVQAGKRQDAIRVLEGLNQQQPHQEQIVYMLGTLHEELGQVGPALTYLKQAAQLHPASSDIQYNLGLAYELSGDREQAEKHYRSALTLNPKATDIAKALARVRNE